MTVLTSSSSGSCVITTRGLAVEAGCCAATGTDTARAATPSTRKRRFIPPMVLSYYLRATEPLRPHERNASTAASHHPWPRQRCESYRLAWLQQECGGWWPVLRSYPASQRL